MIGAFIFLCLVFAALGGLAYACIAAPTWYAWLIVTIYVVVGYVIAGKLGLV